MALAAIILFTGAFFMAIQGQIVISFSMSIIGVIVMIISVKTNN
jgi:hypothetical protein